MTARSTRRSLLPTLAALTALAAAPPNVVAAPVVDEPGLGVPVDEPAAARPPRRAGPGGFWAQRQRGPRMELAYRTYAIAEQGARDARYHTFAVHRYFISGLLRMGGGLEGGFDGSQSGNFGMGSALSVGVQYPARLVPFLECIGGVGFARRQVLQQDLFRFAWWIGIEAGAHFFATDQLLLVLAVGWRRQIIRQGADVQIDPAYVYHDSLAARVGIGF